ncbi:acryloyl-CoA reductase [Brachybacterium phenoliresistens]|uniref:acrylyl-CoA reductase family protein n=1 Tax=Brachybacterium phenoliresistens TaxID=396014 RepID=UPI0031E28C88
MSAITSSTFPAWVVRDGEGGTSAALEQVTPDLLEDRGTTVRVLYSSLNYKDALALHGRPGVVRRTPLIAGIDLTGEVSASEDPALPPGTLVTLDGAGLGEEHHGGLAALADVRAEDLVVVPARFSAAQAAAIGTAGLTAALAVDALERHGLTPDAGPVLVTGAHGGSGGLAIALLAGAGYEVVAATGRPEAADRLRALGAQSILDRAELEAPSRPLARERWAGAVDAAGGQVLASILASLRRGGAVAAFGLVGGSDLPASVMPFILRGVSLLGIDSVRISPQARRAAWDRLSRDLDPSLLDAITRVVPLAAAKDEAAALLEGRGTGRVVVQVGGRVSYRGTAAG